MRRLITLFWPGVALALFLLALTGAGRIAVDSGGLSQLEGNALYCQLTGCTMTGGFRQPYASFSDAGPTALNGDAIVECDTSSNDVTLTIPLAANHGGRQYVIGKSATANDCILQRSGADTFAGELTEYRLDTLQESVIIVSNGVDTWWIVDGSAHGNLSAAAAAHTPVLTGTYERFTSTESETAHQITYSAAEDELTIGWSGEFSIGLTTGFSGAAGNTVTMCVFAGPDGSEVCLPKCFFPRKMAAGGDVGSGAAGCQVHLNSGDRVWLGIKSTGTTLMTLDAMNLQVARIN